MNDPVDLRSDTVTRPTPAMRRAIAEAEVGDDVFGDDPTVQRLEARTAEILGKQAALFMASGTMSNQVAIACQTRPGDEVLLEERSHSYLYEAGGPAVISGVQLRPIPGERGLIPAERLQANLRPPDVHFPESKVLIFENTHNRSGGCVLPLAGMRASAAVARQAGLRIHLDGARLWNAAVASGVPESHYAQICDTVSVCFSKGMGAPVGSALAADAETIARARHIRKRLGGGMRQVGILAAAALYALDNHRERLAEDHGRARKLAVALAEMPGLHVDLDAVETNIVVVQVREGEVPEWIEALRRAGVLVVAFGACGLRAVTHLDINDEDLDRAIAAFRDVAGRRARG